MKKFLFLIVIFFAFNGIAFANFPPDAKTVFVDIHTGTSGVLLNSVNYDRTALYAKITCAVTTDCAITIGNNSPIENNNNIIDSEGITNSDVFVSLKIPANSIVYWHKVSNTDDCNFTLVYTDYDLSLMGTGSPSYYNGGDIFISLMLLIGLVLAIVALTNNRISKIKTYKEYTGVNEIEGKQHYKI
jgi:hypothetical protein